jgi:tetratricopeptide (TPR) repeat protein
MTINGRKPLIILDVFLLIIALSLSVFLLSENDIDYYIELLIPDNTEKFNEYLSKVDRMIKGEGYSSAVSNLKRASSHAKTGVNWLSIIKRAYIISEKTNNPSYYYDYTEKAFNIYPGNEDIRAFQVYSLLRQKYFKEASELSNAIRSPNYLNLKIEAVLTAEFSSETIADPYSYILKLLSDAEDPEIFKKIGTITGNDKVLFDAAVLYMKYGETKKAYNMAKSITGSWVNDEAIGMIAIDSGEYNHALTRFLNHNHQDIKNHNEKWAIQLILADLYQVISNLEISRSFYERSLEINPAGSWNQYANYSRLLKESGRFRQSLDLLQQGISVFPGNEKELIISMVNNQFDKNRSTTERYLKSFLDTHPDDPEANLLYIDHFPIQTTPEKYGARIWELYNKNPSNRKIAEFLLWYLLGVGDLEGTNLVLDRFDRDSGRSYWTVFYRALSLSMAKGFIEAEKLLYESISMRETWFSSYNLAVIQLFLGKYQDVLGNLDRAEYLLNRSNTNDEKYLSSIKTKYASAFIGLNQMDNARIQLEEALALDHENLEAALLTRKIQ